MMWRWLECRRQAFEQFALHVAQRAVDGKFSRLPAGNRHLAAEIRLEQRAERLPIVIDGACQIDVLPRAQRIDLSGGLQRQRLRADLQRGQLQRVAHLIPIAVEGQRKFLFDPDRLRRLGRDRVRGGALWRRMYRMRIRQSRRPRR